MQAEIWIAFAFTIVAIVVTGLVTWWGTKKTIENVTRSVSRNIGEAVERVSKHIGDAVRAIHEDIKASRAKLERRLERKRSSRRG